MSFANARTPPAKKWRGANLNRCVLSRSRMQKAPSSKAGWPIEISDRFSAEFVVQIPRTPGNGESGNTGWFAEFCFHRSYDYGRDGRRFGEARRSAKESVKITSGGGNVDVGRLGGDFSLTTGGGDVRIKNVAGQIRVNIGGGRVSVGSAKGASDSDRCGQHRGSQVQRRSGSKFWRGQPRSG